MNGDEFEDERARDAARLAADAWFGEHMPTAGLTWSAETSDPLGDLRRAKAAVEANWSEWRITVFEIGEGLAVMLRKFASEPSSAGHPIWSTPVHVDPGLRPLAWRHVEYHNGARTVLAEGDEGRRVLGTAEYHSIQDPETGDIWVTVRLG